MLNTFLKSAIIFLVVSGCGSAQLDEYNTQSSLTSVSFSQWCQNSKLKDCTVVPPGAVSQEVWDSSMRIAKTVFTSQSMISLTRADMERPAVARLFDVAGANEIRSLISRVPWQSLTLGRAVADMDNLSRPGSIEFKGLRLTTTGRSKFVWTMAKEINVTGVELSTPIGEKLILSRIDFSKAEKLTFFTNNRIISDIPVNFFAIENLTEPKGSTVESIIKAVSDVIFEPGFNWRNALDFKLDEKGIAVLREEVSQSSNDPLFELIEGALKNTSKLTIGGLVEKDVLAAHLISSVKCDMKFIRVPVIGDLKAGIDFSEKFGISSMSRVGDKVIAKVFGLKTSIGNLESITIEGSKFNLKIGFINIPIDTESKQPGPEISEITCHNI